MVQGVGSEGRQGDVGTFHKRRSNGEIMDGWMDGYENSGILDLPGDTTKNDAFCICCAASAFAEGEARGDKSYAGLEGAG